MAKARFYAVNLLSELDAPGEYYIDRANNTLYYKPTSPLQPSDEIVLSNMSTVVTATGVSGVSLNGLRINYGSQHNLQWKSVTDSKITNCDLGLSGGDAVSVNGAQVHMLNTTIRWAGCRGLGISGGDPKTLTPANIVVENTTIEKFSSWKRTYTPGLSWSGVGNVYRGNLIKDGPHTAAQGGGNDNWFEGNTIDTIAYEVDDSGAWYSGRSWAKRNNTLIGNTFRNINNVVKTYLGSPSVQAIYNDDELSGNTFLNNTFIDCHCGLFIGGGRHHVAKYNKFIRCGTPVHLDDRGLTWQKEYCEPPNGHFWVELKSLNYTNPPYSTRYPDVLTIASDHPCTPVRNVVSDNEYCGSKVFTDASKYNIGKWYSTFENNKENSALCS
eukprot:Hpha_TRINITY_DN6904_c0_g1::TRINITY_DN6904_c0_g1_i2::g.139618::m.139618